MNLYTEEEIWSFLKKEFADEIDAETFIKNLTPLQLPTDEEIGYMLANHVGIHYALQANGFFLGAKCMRNRIQDGNLKFKEVSNDIHG